MTSEGNSHQSFPSKNPLPCHRQSEFFPHQTCTSPFQRAAGRPFGRSCLSRRRCRRTWKVSPRNTAKNRKFFRRRRRIWGLKWNHRWLGKMDFIRLVIRLVRFFLYMNDVYVYIRISIYYSLFQVFKLFGKAGIFSSNLTPESQLPACQLMIVILQHPLLSWRTGTFSLMDGHALLHRLLFGT